MDTTNQTTVENQKQAFNFLTEIYEVMKCFENNPSKLSSKINELKLKYEKARTILSSLPGIDMSHAEQQEYYQNLLKQYKKENELFNSYKEMCKFDITKLDQTPDLTNGANLVESDAINKENQIFNSDQNLD